MCRKLNIPTIKLIPEIVLIPYSFHVFKANDNITLNNYKFYTWCFDKKIKYRHLHLKTQ